MAPKTEYGKADGLERRLGHLMRAPPLNANTTARQMRTALKSLSPKVDVSDGVLRQWFLKYGPAQASVDLKNLTAQELHEQYGELLTKLSVVHGTPWKLRRALSDSALVNEASGGLHTESIDVTEATILVWHRNHYVKENHQRVLSAASLELSHGTQIRDHPELTGVSDARKLHSLLIQHLKVHAQVAVCRQWLSGKWVSSASIADQVELERRFGFLLRSSGYSASFSGQAFGHLIDVFRELSPPIRLTSIDVLKRWYLEYHPHSGSITYSSVADVEANLGDMLRTRPYYGLSSHHLRDVLSHRLKPVLINPKTLDRWIQMHSRSKSLLVMRRPAGAFKRPAAVLSSSAPSGNILKTCEAVEKAIGPDFRSQRADLGFLRSSHLCEFAAQCGFQVSTSVAERYVLHYARSASVAFVDSLDGLSPVARDVLHMRHIKGMNYEVIVEALRCDFGLVVEQNVLRGFLQNSGVEVIDSVTELHRHPAGNFVLGLLQKGTQPEEVLERCLAPPYVVRLNVKLLREYRLFREQKHPSITYADMEIRHWRWLYDHFPACDFLVGRRGSVVLQQGRNPDFVTLLRDFAAYLVLSPESIQVADLRLFSSTHLLHSRLSRPSASLHVNCVTDATIRAYAPYVRGLRFFSPDWRDLYDAIHTKVCTERNLVVWPLALADANITAAFVQSERRDQYRHTCWQHSVVPNSCFSTRPKQSIFDFGFWVAFGSYVFCEACASFYYDDSIFRKRYCHGDNKFVPSPGTVMDPPCTLDGSVSILPESSYWWFQPGIFTLSGVCPFCRKISAVVSDASSSAVARAVPSAGRAFTQALRFRSAQAAALKAKRKEKADKSASLTHRKKAASKTKHVHSSAVPVPIRSAISRSLRGMQVRDATALDPVVSKTGELYRTMIPPGHLPRRLASTDRFVTWPRYDGTEFVDNGTSGPSMLDLTVEQAMSLRIIDFFPRVQIERFGKFGPAEHANYKKVGLSTARYRLDSLSETTLPDDITRAAFRYLLLHNRWYKAYYDKLVQNQSCSHPANITSYGLFVIDKGIECAIWPILYPRTECSDTGIRDHYQELLASATKAYAKEGIENVVTDDSQRSPSLAHSFCRKATSALRFYAESYDLVFFMYERFVAQKFFYAHKRANDFDLTADIMVRHSSMTTGYWEIVQDALADVVRSMAYGFASDIHRGHIPDSALDGTGLAGFPNLFITIAPAEWKFPLPFFLFPYLGHLLSGAFLIAIHMHHLVSTVWAFLCRRPSGLCLSSRFQVRWSLLLHRAAMGHETRIPGSVSELRVLVSLYLECNFCVRSCYASLAHRGVGPPQGFASIARWSHQARPYIQIRLCLCSALLCCLTALGCIFWNPCFAARLMFRRVMVDSITYLAMSAKNMMLSTSPLGNFDAGRLRDRGLPPTNFLANRRRVCRRLLFVSAVFLSGNGPTAAFPCIPLCHRAASMSLPNPMPLSPCTTSISSNSATVSCPTLHWPNPSWSGIGLVATTPSSRPLLFVVAPCCMWSLVGTGLNVPMAFSVNLC